MRLVICTFSDITHDARMQRTATALVQAGYQVHWLGRLASQSPPLPELPGVSLTRLPTRSRRGPVRYAEFSLRLFRWLCQQPVPDILLCVDMDILPAGVLYRRFFPSVRLVFDSHEWMSEVPEVVHRPTTQTAWRLLEGFFIPQADVCYTVSPSLARLFSEKHQVPFGVVRNVPLTLPTQEDIALPPLPEGRFVVYSGAVNVGRGIEMLLRAAPLLPCPVVICGQGDLSPWLAEEVKKSELLGRVWVLGGLPQPVLKAVLRKAWLGVSVLEDWGLSYQYSLANKFFDYVQAGLPQLMPPMPEYQAHNAQFQVGLYASAVDEKAFAEEVLRLWNDAALYAHLQAQCRLAAPLWNWEPEKRTLLHLINPAR